MGELGLNKIMGAVLATLLGLFALHEVSAMVFAGDSGGHGAHGDEHHGDDHAAEKTLYNEMCGKFSHCVESAVLEGGTGGPAPVKKVVDLGLGLLSADATKGARIFKAQCSSCHTIAQGGGTSTGPNLYATVGAAKARTSGFAYSGPMAALGGEWDYQALNSWIEAPAKFVPGTSMSFAGVRKDKDRFDVIAYLTEQTPNAPAYPAPLPDEVEEAHGEGEDHAEEASIEDTNLVIDAQVEGGEGIELTVEETVVEPFIRKIGDLEITGNADGAEAGLVTFYESDKEVCTDAECWFTMDRLTFETGSATIDLEKSTEQLTNIKAIMDAFPTMGLKIGGHTDNTGANEFNLTLSQSRAEAVQAYLATAGIDATRLGAEGYGSEFPVATNDTAEGRAQNRRIDVRVSKR